jgi:hypothetical protein
MNKADVLLAYLECALWSSMDDYGEPLDATYDTANIESASIQSAADDVKTFLANCKAAGLNLSTLSDSQIGHNFWLTRNGHGAGFWDCGLGKLGDELTKLANAAGSRDLCIGRDGALYFA